MIRPLQNINYTGKNNVAFGISSSTVTQPKTALESLIAYEIAAKANPNASLANDMQNLRTFQAFFKMLEASDNGKKPLSMETIKAALDTVRGW